ncbi:hypothetical protein E4T45_00495 [Aureobasidium sp. EXF-8846]|nr:hypothetical protein E4T45_00495 [Aureobasidium sp. EXF-8846]
MVSGLLAAGIQLGMEGTAGMRGWQWFLLPEGVVGVAVGLVGFWGLPNYPHNHGTTWLTPEMAELAQYRMQVSAGGHSEDDEGGAWEGVRLAVRDPFTWLFTVIHFGIILAIFYKDFFPSIVKTLGYSKLMTYLIQAPPYLFAYLFVLAVSWSVGRRMEHCWHIIATGVVGIVGVVIMISTLNPGARYFGMFLLVAGPFAAFTSHGKQQMSLDPVRSALLWSRLLASISSLPTINNLSYTDRVQHCIATVSHRFSPYFFLTSQQPRYKNAGGLIITGSGIGIIGCLATKWYVKRLNKKLDEQEAATNAPKGWRYVE